MNAYAVLARLTIAIGADCHTSSATMVHRTYRPMRLKVCIQSASSLHLAGVVCIQSAVMSVTADVWISAFDLHRSAFGLEAARSASCPQPL